VTIQTVSVAADGVMLLVAAGVAGLLAAAIVLLARRRLRAAGLAAGALAVVVVVYGAVLVGVGVASRPQQLGVGDTKCFDDWCAGLVSARQDGAAGRWLVDVQVQNRGRGRAMRSNLARAYLELPGGGQVAAEDGSGLQVLVEPGGRADVPLVFPTAAAGARLVVVEGGSGVGPGTFEIGGEGSPFHARAGWPLR
jgi:hypothetical protein